MCRGATAPVRLEKKKKKKNDTLQTLCAAQEDLMFETGVHNDGFEKHFVVGKNKLGVLWNFHAYAMLSNDSGTLVAVEVEFHEQSQHIDNPALGGVIVHGGASAACIDAFAGATGMAALQNNMTVATAKQTLTYKRPLFVGKRCLLLCVALSVEIDKDKSSLVRSKIVNDTGVVCIECETLMQVKQKRTKAKL